MKEINTNRPLLYSHIAWRRRMGSVTTYLFIVILLLTTMSGSTLHAQQTTGTTDSDAFLPLISSSRLNVTEVVQSSSLDPADVDLTLMLLTDVHGHMIPHAEFFPGERIQVASGGLAKLGTVINDVRAATPGKNLLLMAGDATHGGAEALFTLGDSMMPAFNAFGIDAFTPGNWDFGYGPRTFRNRFAGANLALTPNNRTTLDATKVGCATAAPTCNVTPANFPTVAINLYNFNEVTGEMGSRILPPFIIKEVNGIKVGILGITNSRLPVQNPAFSLGMTFTKGYVELPETIADAKSAGADLIVLMSELGLADNLQIAKEIAGIDFLLGADSHEVLVNALVVQNIAGGQTIVAEAGEDAYLGRIDLDLDIGSGSGPIKEFDYTLIEVDDSVAEDPVIKALVDEERKTFVAGPDFSCHTFGTAGFAFGEGHTLCEPLETVVGTTEVSLERRSVLEDEANNFTTDAFLAAISNAGGGTGPDTTFAITNGFRFDIVVLGKDTPLPGGGLATGNITIQDLYYFFPITPSVATAEFTGGVMRGKFEDFLEAVFDPNPFRRRGGWWMGFSNNMRFTLDLQDAPFSVPLATKGGRVRSITINGNRWDPSEIYTMIGCYPHSDSTDRICRTSGARNIQFLCGDFNPDLNTPSQFSMCGPLNTKNIIDTTRAPVILQVAPNNFIQPVEVLREYLKTHTINEAEHGLGRTTAIGGEPISTFDPTLVQPIQGAGPAWLGRGVVMPADTVAIDRAEYDAGDQELRVEVLGSSSMALLTVEVTATGELIGQMENEGGGDYELRITWPVNPQNVTVRSSEGGVASANVELK